MEGLSLQDAVLISVLIIDILSIILALLMSLKYNKNRSKTYLFWSAGLWAFTISVFLEILFALGIYNEFLISTYVFLVALLVELLALGSIQFFPKFVRIYYIFCLLSTLALIISLFFVNIGNIIQNYVVYGALPLVTTIISSIITFPAAAIIIISAILTIKRTGKYKDSSVKFKKRVQMISIIIGVLFVSLAGTLYIASYPELLYWSEFGGIVLLWIGFI
ncbi:MAG: hypothetical protein QXL76_00360 [Candidatus Rehaiarchaeum fermentans]|nr:hypothetical protein [Candidatus Rehaiarchaeum fermentans]